MKTFKVLSIDAWADGDDSWTWNNWFTEGTYNEEERGPLTDENALKFFLEEYALNSEEFLSKYELDDDQYNIILVRKDNRKPILAIEYGNHF